MRPVGSRRRLGFGVLLCLALLSARAAHPSPAIRIVSLAPHLTELLFAAGAGAQVVGVVAYSDYPAAAAKLPRVGDSTRIDSEAILALKPDLVVAWTSGTPPQALDQLRRLGLRLEGTDVRRLADVPELIERLGVLAGTSAEASLAARQFRARLQALERRHTGAKPVAVFYQVADEALFTVNGEHWVSDALRVCNARNVFDGAPVLAGPVDLEAVVRANPRVIVASGQREDWERWTARWQGWPQIEAVRAGNLFYVAPDLMHRPGPRLIEGTEQLCALIERARR